MRVDPKPPHDAQCRIVDRAAETAAIVGTAAGTAAGERKADVKAFPAAFRTSLAVAALALAAGAFMPGTARAQGFQENDTLKSAMQLFGLLDEEPRPEIEYRERAPLVVPPTAPDALPAPQDAAHQNNPNWPKDPDVLRRKQELDTSRRPVIRDDPGRPLMPSELNKGRTKIGQNYDATTPVPTGTQRDEIMPSELGFKGWLGNITGKQEQLTFSGEPARESLVQPPPGYQTPAPNAPYGVVEEKKEAFKFPTFFDMQK